MSQSRSETNQLAGASSPYLLLHQHNPVDWYPWGPEALERAVVEDKPIFLSVGYSTCYWCHVMERESFSDPAIAERMNRHFVNIKVDREERPELDEMYMVATQILTQQGGWPNSVFLTPDLKPFFAGTYFPPVDQPGRPGMVTLVESLAAAWQQRREEVLAQADSVAEAMRHHLETRTEPAEPPASLVRDGLRDLERRFDAEWGGFGGAPKFPTPSNLFLLLEVADEQPQAAAMLAVTLDRMARGGIFDQLGGGFHRYATDREWKIPHFEKMLYDNGLLLEVYARQWARTASPQAERITRQTAAFLARELTSPEGAFYSAIDAETEGHEGAFYVWTRQELLQILGDEDFGFLAPLFGFSGPPFFEGRHHVLHLPQPLAQQAERRRLPLAELEAQLAPLQEQLLAARRRRPRPLTDDKILTDWNGMAIGGLAVAGRLLSDATFLRRAGAAADFVLDTMRPGGGPLRHSWRQGRHGVAAFLADYAFLIRGLLELHSASAESRWLRAAEELAAEQEERLGDPSGGYYVAAQSPEVLFRSKEVLDGAVPGANGVAALNLLQLAAATGDSLWSSRCEAALRAFAQLGRQLPAAVKTLALASQRRLQQGLGTHAAGGDVDHLPELPSQEIELAAELELATPNPDGWRPFRLRLGIPAGWHVYGPSAIEVGVPLTVTGEEVTLRDLTLPAGERLSADAAVEGVETYEGEIGVEGELSADSSRPGYLIVGYQACDERRCLRPARLRLALNDASEV